MASQLAHPMLLVGNKLMARKRLRAGATNKADLGGVLHAKYIHIAALWSPWLTMSRRSEVVDLARVVSAYPQTKRRIETALAEKVADVGRFGCWTDAAQVAPTPRGAWISGKKKGPEIIQALVYGCGL